jgi:hypothetical protein
VVTPGIRRIVLVAEDCPAQEGETPGPGRSGPTVAQVQYDLLAAEPFRWTEDDVLFESWWRRQDAAATASAADKEHARADYLARPRPCLRASPLPMRYGWGLVFDDQDRVALCPVGSPEYRALAAGDGGVEVQRSFRRTRRPSAARSAPAPGTG